MGEKQAISTVFYDSSCGLCHRWVRFVVRRDPDGKQFEFAPLGGQYFLGLVPASERAGLPDSVVVRTAEGALFVRSAGVLHILRQLGGPWRAVAAVIGVLPASVNDFFYDQVARLRRRWFRPPADVCPALPAHLRARFRA